MTDAILIDYVAEEPPTVAGSGDLCEQQGPLATGAASSAAQTIAHIPVIGECLVTFTLSAAARFNFGSSVSVAAATATSASLPAGKHRLRITQVTKFFTVIQDTAVGSLSWWRSSR